MASNNVMIVRHKLLEKLVALWKENQLVEKIDRVPLEFSPRRSQPVGRCCIHPNFRRIRNEAFDFQGKGQNEAFKKGKRATLKKPKQKFCNDLCFGFIIS